MNIPAPLLPVFEQGLLDEVIRPLMSGKEASVYLVRARGTLCVAKIYKDALHRSFRQRAAYTEGRQVRSSRERRAIQKGSTFGKSRIEAGWQDSEVLALRRLYEAGVRVPIPYHHGENVLLMELVMDAAGEPAPRLFDMDLTESDALLVHEIMIREIVRMLCAGLVHGDLSEYNILMAADGPVIIDLPQAMDAATNQNSEELFLRDVQNLANYLGRAAPSLRRTQYGPEIWDLYSRAALHPDSELTGRFQKKEKQVDAAGVIAEIREAAEDAEKNGARPMSAYQLKKKKQAEAARAAPPVAEQTKPSEPAAKRPRRRRRNRGKGPGSGPGPTNGNAQSKRRR